MNLIQLRFRILSELNFLSGISSSVSLVLERNNIPAILHFVEKYDIIG